MRPGKFSGLCLASLGHSTVACLLNISKLGFTLVISGTHQAMLIQKFGSNQTNAFCV